MRTLIASVERFSRQDGPGIRTVIFLKGCPLRCLWCHNPECISFEHEEFYDPEKCIGCGRCAEGCVSGARVGCGTERSVEDLVREAAEDLPYYGKTGGVTLSGGEPLAHPAFAGDLLRALRKAGISCAVETSLCRYDEDLLRLCDLLMIDLKHMDPAEHLRLTGIGNRVILENLRRTDRLGIPIIVRTPLVAGLTDGEENIRAAVAFLKELRNLRAYELLPYHPFGVEKAKRLGKVQPEFSAPSAERIAALRKLATEATEKSGF